VCVTVKLISFVNHVFPPSSMFGLFVCLGNYCCFRCCYQRRVERRLQVSQIICCIGNFEQVGTLLTI